MKTLNIEHRNSNVEVFRGRRHFGVWKWVSGVLPLLAALALLIPPAACAGTITLRPVEDSEIHQFSPDNNFGSAANVVSGALGFTASREIRRALFRFDP